MPERIWAGWRMAYIRAGQGESPAAQERESGEVRADGAVPSGEDPGCLFCELGARSPGPDTLVIERYRFGFVVLNAFPYCSGHLMVAPYRHGNSLTGESAEARAEHLAAVERARRVLEIEYRPQGFNIGLNLGRAGGAGVPDHLHWHIIPRWHGDTNFTTTVADLRVLPEALTDSFDRLCRGYASLLADGVEITGRVR